jgi:hypothetical protein
VELGLQAKLANAGHKDIKYGTRCEKKGNRSVLLFVPHYKPEKMPFIKFYTIIDKCTFWRPLL